METRNRSTIFTGRAAVIGSRGAVEIDPRNTMARGRFCPSATGN